MSRSLERVSHGFAAPGLVSGILAVPADHKYEVVAISWQGDLVHAQVAYAFWSSAAVTFVGIDQWNMVATKYAETHNYEGIVLYAGNTLDLWHAGAAGTAFASVFYIDVDYTT